jgi:hypothetical protein
MSLCTLREFPGSSFVDHASPGRGIEFSGGATTRPYASPGIGITFSLGATTFPCSKS